MHFSAENSFFIRCLPLILSVEDEIREIGNDKNLFPLPMFKLDQSTQTKGKIVFCNKIKSLRIQYKALTINLILCAFSLGRYSIFFGVFNDSFDRREEVHIK